jgi:predicted enzyme related to lactoylglutathione lyase
MTIRNAIASIAVADLAAALPWYERLFGRAADGRPMEEVAEWKFERGGWLQVYQLPERAGHCSVTFSVDDIEQQIAELRALGLDAGKLIISDQVKVVMLKDPAGNSLAFAQALAPGLAR